MFGAVPYFFAEIFNFVDTVVNLVFNFGYPIVDSGFNGIYRTVDFVLGGIIPHNGQFFDAEGQHKRHFGSGFGSLFDFLRRFVFKFDGFSLGLGKHLFYCSFIAVVLHPPQTVDCLSLGCQSLGLVRNMLFDGNGTLFYIMGRIDNTFFKLLLSCFSLLADPFAERLFFNAALNVEPFLFRIFKSFKIFSAVHIHG